MFRGSKLKILVFSLCILAFSLVSCSKEPETNQEHNKDGFVGELAIELPYEVKLDVGDLYQIEPEITGFTNPEFFYKAEMPEIASVDEGGVVTVHGTAVVSVWVTVREEGTTQSVTKEILILCGDVFHDSK